MGIGDAYFKSNTTNWPIVVRINYFDYLHQHYEAA